jgi:hypothetical protein
MQQRRRIRYADVMSTIAVFMALSGVAYAAVKLPADSVGAKQIKRGAVRGDEVRNGSLGADDFKAGVLPSAQSGSDGESGADGADGSDGSDGSNGADGAAGPQGPAGPAGPAGPQGPAGAEGPPGAQGLPGTARVYGVIDPTCSGGVCTVTKNNGINGVRRILAGMYCIDALPVSGGGAPALATVDFNGTASPQAQTSALVDTSNAFCDPGEFFVMTTRRASHQVKNTSNTTVTVGGTETLSNTVAFVFLVP